MSTGTSPQTPLGELTALPRPLSGFKEGLGIGRREEKWRMGKGGEWGNREGGKGEVEGNYTASVIGGRAGQTSPENNLWG